MLEEALGLLEGEALAQLAVEEGLRPDGRSLTQARPMVASAGILPRVHGSALVELGGDVQVLASATVGEALPLASFGGGGGGGGGAGQGERDWRAWK